MPKTRSNKLPDHAAWNLEADLAFIKRYRRLVSSAPAYALNRMREYLASALEDASLPPPEAPAPNGSAPEAF